LSLDAVGPLAALPRGTQNLLQMNQQERPKCLLDQQRRARTEDVRPQLRT
jgi:hypothetical protein